MEKQALPITPRLLRIPDAAKYLSCTNWFLETLLREKTVPSFIQGKRKLVDVRDLDAYVDRLKVDEPGEKTANVPAVPDPSVESLFLIDISTAARLMSTTVFAVRQLLRDGEIAYLNIGHKWLISPDAIRNFIRKNEATFEGNLKSSGR